MNNRFADRRICRTSNLFYTLRVLVAAGVVGLAGCGLDTPDDDSGGHDHNHGESDMQIGLATSGAGELGIDYDFRRTADLACEEIGGLAFCSSTEPGLVPLEADESVFFRIPAGVPVSIELTAIDNGARVVVRDTVIDLPGESAALGETDEERHVHPQWQVVAAPGDLAAEYRVSFKLTSTEAGFQDSEVYTLVLTPSRGD